jgi:hypothetical protein
LDGPGSLELANFLQNGNAPSLLRLQECHFQDPLVVFNALKDNKGLTSLQLNYKKLDDKFIQGLRGYLGNNDTLKDLELTLPRSDQNLTSHGTRIGRLFDFLADNCRLSTLSFTCLPLTANDLISLGSALPHNSSLRTLVVHADVSIIPIESFINFASQIAMNRHLKEFHLSGFPILPLTAEEDGERFLEAIRNNVTLEQFTRGFPKGTREPRWFLEFQFLLRLNRAGRKYILEDPTNNLSCAEILGAVRDELNCIYLHLRHNPSFCQPASTSKEHMDILD